MKIPVHMFAFSKDRNVVRYVDIPDEKSRFAKIGDLLELVFYYGQNDFQPQNIYSVSVGDVAEISEEYYMVRSIGWNQISKQEFESLVPPTSDYAYRLGFKEI